MRPHLGLNAQGGGGELSVGKGRGAAAPLSEGNGGKCRAEGRWVDPGEHRGSSGASLLPNDSHPDH